MIHKGKKVVVILFSSDMNIRNSTYFHVVIMYEGQQKFKPILSHLIALYDLKELYQGFL